MGLYKDQIDKVRARIREFEDRKITASQLQRDMIHAAREIADSDEGSLRRLVERTGMRVGNLTEIGHTHSDFLKIVDDFEAELVEMGY
jgi:hypothetical protein